MQKCRLATGGDIDRGHPVRFEFNGAPLEGWLHGPGWGG